MKQIKDLFTSTHNHLKMKETLLTKITGGGSFLSILIGAITQEDLMQLAGVSYIAGTLLAIVTVVIKIYEFCKSFKNK